MCRLLLILLAVRVTGWLTVNTPKTKAVEARLNAIIPKIPAIPQSSPGFASSVGGGFGGISNTSYTIASNSTLATTVTAYNDLRNSYSNNFSALNSAINGLNSAISGYNDLEARYNNLVTALLNAKVIV